MYKTEYINKKLILDAGSFAFFRFFKDGTSFSFFHRKIAQMPIYFSQDPQFMPKNRGMNVKLMHMPKEF